MTRFFLLLLFIIGYGMVPCHAVLPGSSQNRRELSIYNLPPFERAVRCIKYYEQIHTSNQYPYIGFGHKIRPGENLDYSMTEQQADSLLRADLLRMCALFRSFGKDSLLLGTLSYNVGPSRLLGNSKYPKSLIIQKLERGDRDIKVDYQRFSYWKGKYIPSIRRRRIIEYELLFMN